MVELKVPKDWKKIEEKNYTELGIINNEQIGCLGAYAVLEDGENCVIVFNDYSRHDAEFIKYLDEQMTQLEELNYAADGDPSDRDYEDTAILKNLYHGYINKNRGMFYLNVNKMLIDVNKYAYTFQMFTQGKNGIFAVQSNINKLDEKNVENTIDDIPHIKNAVVALIKLANG